MKWKQEKRKVTDLKPAAYNPRIQLSGKKLRDLMNSLDEFDLAVPLVINTDNTIIGGHQRYFILKKKGVKEVPVQVPEKKLTPAQEKKLNIRLNKNTGEWDNDKLAEFSYDLLEETGFTIDELEVLGMIDPKIIPTIELPTGEKSPFQQMVFMFSDAQAEKVKEAIKLSKSLGSFTEYKNENSNGNAIARIIEAFLNSNESSKRNQD